MALGEFKKNRLDRAATRALTLPATWAYGSTRVVGEKSTRGVRQVRFGPEREIEKDQSEIQEFSIPTYSARRAPPFFFAIFFTI
jgi:hypothetical protein